MRLRALLIFAIALSAFSASADDALADYAVYDTPTETTVQKASRRPSRVHPVARAAKLVDEVEEEAAATRSEKNGEDDYSEFADKQPANGGANHELKQVTFAPDVSTTYRLPVVPEDTKKKLPDPAIDRVPERPNVPTVVTPRSGYFYQHYPWDRLPRAFNLNPGLQYTYPTQFQNAVWSYPTQTLDYKGYGWYGNVQQHVQRQQQEYAYQQQYRDYYNQAIYHRQYGTSQPGGFGGGCGGGGCGGNGSGCSGGSSGGGGGCGGGRSSDKFEDGDDDDAGTDDSFRRRSTRRHRKKNRAI